MPQCRDVFAVISVFGNSTLIPSSSRYRHSTERPSRRPGCRIVDVKFPLHTVAAGFDQVAIVSPTAAARADTILSAPWVSRYELDIDEPRAFFLLSSVAVALCEYILHASEKEIWSRNILINPGFTTSTSPARSLRSMYD
jgi:hypothetical protein